MIQRATLAHLDPLTLLFEAYRAFYKKEADLEGARQFLSRRIENNESVIYVLHAPNGAMVGFTQLYPLFSSTRMKRLWLLNDLFVHPDYRGQGYSKALLQQAQAFAVETDACGVMLETAKNNTIGNRLYPSMDFELDEEFNVYNWTNK
jgi:ribosomal protein S18 acetylase RimI-like enzyme